MSTLAAVLARRPAAAALARGARRRIPPYLPPVLVAVAATFTWFDPGAFVASGDVAPFLRDGLAGEIRSLWNHQLTGAGSTSYEIVRALEVALVAAARALGGGETHAQHALFAIAMGGAAFGSARLAAVFVERPVAIAAAGLIGAFNPFVLVVLPNVLPLLALGLVGILAAAVLDAARARRPSPVAFAFATLPGSYVAANPPLLALVAAAVVGAAALAPALFGRGSAPRALRFLAVAAPLILVLNAWWAWPFVQANLEPAGVSFAAETDITSWSWSHARSSLANVAALNSHWGWVHPDYYPYASKMEALPWGALKWVLPLLALAAPVAAAGQRRRQALVLAAVAAPVIFLAKGLHPPLAGVNLWLYEHVPGLWLLRDPMSKLGILLVLVYACLAAITVAGALERRRGRPRRAVVVVGAAVVALAHPWPLWTGAVAPGSRGQMPSSRVVVPAGWHRVADAVNSSDTRGKALVLPLNPYYQMKTEWGYYGVDALPQQLLARPVIQRLPGGYFAEAPAFDGALEAVERALRFGDEASIPGLLRFLGVSHVVLRHDLAPSPTGRRFTDPGELGRGLEAAGGLRPALRTEVADVYEVRAPAGVIRAAGGAVAAHAAPRATGLVAAALPDGSVAVDPSDGLPEAHHVPAPAAGRPVDFAVGRPGRYEISRHPVAPRRYRIEIERRGERAHLVVAPPAALALDGRRLPPAAAVEVLLPGASSAVTVGGDVVTGNAPELVTLTGRADVVAYRAAGRDLASGFGKLEDCNQVDARSAREAGLRKRVGRDGSVRLAARAHSACVSTRPRPLRHRAYLVRLEHRTRHGAPARLCMWQEGPDRCAPLPPAPRSSRWSSYEAVVVPERGTAALSLYLYADGERPRTVTAYRAVSMRGLTPVARRTVELPPPQPVLRYLAAGTHQLSYLRPAGDLLGAFGGVEDCNASGAGATGSPALDATRDGGTLRLRAHGNSACVNAPIEHSGRARYRITLAHRSLSGAPARLCVWQVGPNRCAELPPLQSSRRWRRFEAVMVPEAGTTALRLYLYADGSGTGTTATSYRDLSVLPVSAFDVTVVDASLGSTAAPGAGWMSRGPDQYRVALAGSDGAAVVVLAESFAPGWRLSGARATHVRADGYANAWIVDDPAGATLTISYAPARRARTAQTLSLVAALGAAAAAGVRLLRRRYFRSGARAAAAGGESLAYISSITSR